MKLKITFFYITLTFFIAAQAQSLVDTIPFPYHNAYNSIWGLCQGANEDELYLGSDWKGEIYTFDTATGQLTDSIFTDLGFNHGFFEHEGFFWVAEDYSTKGANLYKVGINGFVSDTLHFPDGIGGKSGGVGGLSFDGEYVWFTVYYPDFDEFPFSYAYKMSFPEWEIIDTLPLYGKQIYGITQMGTDTIIYVNDNNDEEEERIFVYSLCKEDTLYSIKLPDDDGDMSPRGLHWDGEYLWLSAKRTGSAAFAFQNLYKYEIPRGEATRLSYDKDSLYFGFFGDYFIFDNLKIENNTEETITIISIDIDEPLIKIVEDSNLPIVLNPGDTYNFSLEPSEYLAGGAFESWLIIISENSCRFYGDSIFVESMFYTGLDNRFFIDNIEVFPNPSKDILNISYALKQNNDYLEINLYDIQGRKVKGIFEGQISGQQDIQVNVADYPSGLYRLVLNNEKEQLSYPVMIVRE